MQGKIGRCIGEKKYFQGNKAPEESAQEFSVKPILCALQGIYSCAKGSAASREGNGELWCCSCCRVEKGLSLLTDFSSHRKHHAQKTKSCTSYVSIPW